jgi:predicted transcriptional regulator
MNFSEKLKRICALENTNLKEISDLTDIPYQSLKNYSSGKRQPKFSQLEKITSHKRFSKYRDLLFGTHSRIQTDPIHEVVMSSSTRRRANNLSSMLEGIDPNDGLLLINQFEALIDTYHKTKILIKIQEERQADEYND